MTSSVTIPPPRTPRTSTAAPGEGEDDPRRDSLAVALDQQLGEARRLLDRLRLALADEDLTTLERARALVEIAGVCETLEDLVAGIEDYEGDEWGDATP